MIARGKTGEGVTLAGSPLSTSVVKVFELEAIGVTVAGPAEFSLGLMSPNDVAAGIQLDAVPIDAGVAQAGRVRLLLRDGSSEGKRTLFAEGNDGQILDGGTVIDDLDLGVIVNCETKTARAHLGYSYVSCGPDGFPAGQVAGSCDQDGPGRGWGGVGKGAPGDNWDIYVNLVLAVQ